MDIPLTPSGKPLLKEQEGYNLSKEEDVYRYFQSDFQQDLDHYLSCFEEFNNEYLGTGVDKELMPKLPYAMNDRFWKVRQKDLVFLENRLDEGAEVLEVGTWNGWLANALSQKGHSVTAMDYFLDEVNGLKTRKHYPEAKWTSLNMDVDDLNLLTAEFDAIVFNRSVSYYSDFEGVIRKAQSLLKEGGILVLTGLNVLANPDIANVFYNHTAEVFRERYERSMEIKPNSKKMLNDDDLKSLLSLGFVLISNDGGLQHALKKYVMRKRSRSYTALYKKDKIG